MRILLTLGLVAALAALGGCGWHHFDNEDDDVVIESEEPASLRGGCIVRGSVRNEGRHTLRVFITWRAFDRDDDRIGFAEVEIRDLPRNESRSYESTRFEDFDGDRPSCDEIVRIRHSVFATRD
jgi:hypothetical protein